LLIYGDEKAIAGLPTREQDGLLSEFHAYTESVKEKGAHIASQRLRPTSTATSVRVRDGKKLITDGPFAETKEQLGGFYMIEAKDLDEAVLWAGKIPGARYGTIEVRPIWEM
jgi:hypothetical protein